MVLTEKMKNTVVETNMISTQHLKVNELISLKKDQKIFILGWIHMLQMVGTTEGFY